MLCAAVAWCVGAVGSRRMTFGNRSLFRAALTVLFIVGPGLLSKPNTHTKLATAWKGAASSNKPRILVSQVPSIHWNLALETFLVEDVKPPVPWLFLWRNEKTIVIGQSQNPWSECALRKMEEDGVALARRFSGGGAVYQDMGNTCFSFMFPDGGSNITRNNEVILSALRDSFKIDGKATGRNDLTVDGKKFSGFAAKKNGSLWVHHGTVLRDVDMAGLQRYLTPNKMKFESKGVKSMPSRVINLKEIHEDISHDSLVNAISREFLREFGFDDSVEPELMDETSTEAQDPRFLTHLQKLKDWNWRYGTTPQFTHKLTKRFDWGVVEVHLDVNRGIVYQVKVFTDSLVLELSTILEKILIGRRYGPGTLGKPLPEAAKAESPEVKKQIEDVATWLEREVAEEEVMASMKDEL